MRLLRLRRRSRAAGVRRLEGGRQRAHGADPDPVQRRCRPRERRADHHRQPVADRHPGRGAAVPDGDVLHAPWRTVPARSAVRVGTPTIRRTTTSCTTCSPPTRSAGTTTASTRTPSSTISSLEAKQETDPDTQGELFRQAESILLNDDIGAIPINWYRGDYVYNPETVSNFPQTNLGLILWEQVTVSK